MAYFKVLYQHLLGGTMKRKICFPTQEMNLETPEGFSGLPDPLLAPICTARDVTLCYMFNI